MNSDAVNLGIAKIAAGLAVNRRGATDDDGFLAAAARPDAAPTESYVYFYAVIAGWYILALAAGLLMVGLAYLGHLVDGDQGNRIGVTVGVALAAFCIIGAMDATWRSLLVYAAKRRAQTHGADDQRAHNEMRAARLRYPVLSIQVTGAAVCAIAAVVYL
jgi:hypothetical protein